MKTATEILEKLRKPSFLGFETEALVQFLSFEEAKPILIDNSDPEKWSTLERTEENVKNMMREYMEFAWEKVQNHRGISAEKNIVTKMEAWIWLMGDEELLMSFNCASYAMYGAPKLAVVCNAYGFQIPSNPSIHRMIQSLPCKEGCLQGC